MTPLERLQRALALRILELFDGTAVQITLQASSLLKGREQAQVLKLADHPGLKAAVQAALSRLQGSLYILVANTMSEAWDLAELANDKLVGKTLKNGAISDAARSLYYGRNLEAKMGFILRAERGFTLSQRVWNTMDGYMVELEGALGLALQEGKSAARLATEVKKYLRDPDKLFRRVRDAQGRLRLSQAARNYHPGRGVYRSSYKNALRLAATETSMAYRLSDYQRWQRLPFVVGIDVQLSSNHPVYDICDHLKGRYPKDFCFSGWHPHCRCRAVPVLMNAKEYSRYEAQILKGETPRVPPAVYVEAPPQKFNRWIQDNRERVEGWARKPYWWKDNRRFVQRALR